jgi:hypothetical protein
LGLGIVGGFNTYGYVYGNPTGLVDVDGKLPIAPIAIVITAGAIGATLIAMNKTMEKCKSLCNPNACEVGEEFSCKQRITQCQLAALSAYSPFLQKYSSPTPPLQLLERIMKPLTGNPPAVMP